MLSTKLIPSKSKSLDLSTWSRQTPVAVTTLDLYDGLYTSSQFLAVGSSGAVVTSADGTSWTAQSSGLSVALNGVTKGGTLSLYVAVGASAGAGGAATSPDGITWTDRSSTAGSNILYSVAAAPSIVVAVGLSGAAMSSSNGTSWGADTSNTTETLEQVIWSGTIFVAVGRSGTIRTRTTSNSSWTTRTSGTTDNIFGVAYSGVEYVAARSNGFLRSTDAVTWSLISFTGTWLDVLWDGTQFVARNSTNDIATSPDGNTWTGGKEVPTSERVEDIVFGNGKLLALGKFILETTDLTNWSIASNAQTVNSVAYSAQLERFVAVGMSGLLVSSDDGFIWKSRRSRAASPAFLNWVVWSGTQFVAVGSQGGSGQIITTSPDGITWTLRYSNTVVSGELKSITWTGSQFVAVGLGSNAISSDGITWTLTSGISFNAIAYSPSLNLYVAGGTATNQNLASSTDGINWTIRVTTGFSVQAIAWNGTTFVAVGLSGAIRTSTNGTSWTTRTSGTTQNLIGVTWTDVGFVAVGATGAIRTSLDGTTWVGRTSGTSETLRGTAASPDRAVAAGTVFTILSTQ